MLLGYAAIPLFLRLLAIFGEHRELGVLLIIVTNMIQVNARRSSLATAGRAFWARQRRLCCTNSSGGALHRSVVV